jgi:peptide-methionine (R)-S-oxide reductase
MTPRPGCLESVMNHPAPETRANAVQRSAAGFDLSPPSRDQFHALTADLAQEEREVILEHRTEAPFCGVFIETKAPGAYLCCLRGLPLFRSGTKFGSGTGWPSFFDPIDRTHLKFVRDTSTA